MSDTRETWPCPDCGHKHYVSQECPAHQWTDFCPYEGIECPDNVAALVAAARAELIAEYGENPTLNDILPPAED